MAEPIAVTGHTFLRLERGQLRRLMAHRLTLTIDGDVVLWAVQGEPQSTCPEQTVSSMDHAVRRHLTSLIAALEASAYRDRPIAPDPKPKDRKSRRVARPLVG